MVDAYTGTDTQTGRDKPALRAILRARRRALDARQQLTAAAQAALLIQNLSTWRRARRIALYRDTDGELGTSKIIGACIDQDKELYLPVVGDNRQLEFARWAPGETLAESRMGIAEPLPAAQRCPAANLDIVFLPLVGWDKQGNRLGMGGGFYDTTFAAVEGPVLVGLAHSVQELAQIPSESWDIKLDIIVTETGSTVFRRNQPQP